ncbi:hypothetical protein J5Y03_16830 [Bacillus sp. RG28]|uniref:Uncharacterized protein n=1 Tax=Gottfriedia endophytica TaxID=2820819 RepID=A0A940NR95_9BACI|nr:hypothetical protein [Gottfriedia endophytica]MBP0726824.1 hypothetical protein [Gottfriedia endophytica]
MKRYRNSIILLVIAVITLGTFYVRVGLSASNLPEIYIKNEYGDKNEASPILLSSIYSKGSRSEPVSITQKGSSYSSQKSFIDQLEPVDFNLEKLNKLQKEERQFMRGKKDSNGFYIENNFIVYGRMDYSYDSNHQVSGIHFKIYTLDKKNNETQSFDIPAPLNGSYSYINITDVQVIGKELKIITSGYSNKSFTAIQEYSINLVKKEVVNHSTIVQGQNEVNGIRNDISGPQEVDVTEPKNYEVATKVVTKETVGVDGNQPSSKELSSNVMVYNLKTNQIETPKMSQEKINKLAHSTRLFQQGDIVYSITQDDKGMDVLKYNLKLQKIVSEQRFLNSSFGTNSVNDFKIKNDKLYVVSTKNIDNSLPSIMVVDLQTNKPIYKGRVVIKNNNNKDMKDNMVKLFSNNIYIN